MLLTAMQHIEQSYPWMIFDGSNSLGQIGYFLDSLKANYSHKVEVIEYGKSSEGRPLRAVRVKPYSKYFD